MQARKLTLLHAIKFYANGMQSDEFQPTRALDVNF